MAKVAINGLGRIGRATLKILLDTSGLELVAVNELMDAGNVAYLLNHDTVYGRYKLRVRAEQGVLQLDGQQIDLLSEPEPDRLPWGDLGVEAVFECTGRFTDQAGLQKHLAAGARLAILSAPTDDREVVTVVYGVNQPSGSPRFVSCASCTTNCVAPLVEVIERRFGIQKASLNTVHAYTASQAVVDGPANKPRRGRAAAANLVPTTTGAARAVARALPQIAGRFDGVAVRAPVPVGSLADLVFVLKRRVTVEEVNRAIEEEAASERYRQVLGVSADPMVSSDVIGDSRAAVIDPELTQVIDGDLLRVMAWYDNEWGYASQMVREAKRLLL